MNISSKLINLYSVIPRTVYDPMLSYGKLICIEHTGHHRRVSFFTAFESRHHKEQEVEKNIHSVILTILNRVPCSPRPFYFTLLFFCDLSTKGLNHFCIQCHFEQHFYFVPSLMALWMCIPGAFFPLLTQAAVGLYYCPLLS